MTKTGQARPGKGGTMFSKNFFFAMKLFLKTRPLRDLGRAGGPVGAAVLVIGLFSTALAAPTVQTSCASGSAGSRSFNWCVSRYAGSSSKDVIYYLHGNGGNERGWATPGHDEIVNAMGELTKDVPSVVTISYGSTWFLSATGGFFHAPLLEDFTERAIPFVESQLGFTPNSRAVFGESMGGFNAFQVYAKAPKAFRRFVVSCPAILSFSPQADDDEVNAYIARHVPYVLPQLVQKWRGKMQSEYPGADDWQAHDPQVLARGLDQHWPKLYLTSDGHDQFAFNEATDRVQKILSARRAPLQFHFIPEGSHCDLDATAKSEIAAFLLGR